MKIKINKINRGELYCIPLRPYKHLFTIQKETSKPSCVSLWRGGTNCFRCN